MEHKLRCNTLKCRKELGGRALVTTCSLTNLFLFQKPHLLHRVRCSVGSRRPRFESRHTQEHVCPACHTALPNPDDAVIADLSPSEDYKASVLSGLSPTVIMECASRALAFWAYQTTQEVFVQCRDPYSTDEQKVLRDKNAELAQAYKDKNRKLLQVQELYDKLKRKAMLGQIQDAAEDAIDSNFRPDVAIDGGVHAYGDDDPNVAPFYQGQGAPYGRPGRQLSDTTNRMGSIYSTRDGLVSQGPSFPRTIGAQADIPITPSTHRQRLGEPTGLGLNAVPGLASGSVRSPRLTANVRAPLSELHGNFRHNGRLTTGGLSSGLKVGLGSRNLPEYSAASRPQAIQRPAPSPSVIGRRNLAHSPESVLGNRHGASITGNMKRGYAPR
ncbi:hypothetical protein PG994_013295 [Apiospora phragmitis]|uniref:E3 ubiquitin-protein ligase CCNB1IP1 n=1 Tax=Apiospora phragmitis TaxID=2905665 RepID=A0ABR1T877_9PEZI